MGNTLYARYAYASVIDSIEYKKNIMRKCKPNAFISNGVSGVVVHPVIIKILSYILYILNFPLTML